MWTVVTWRRCERPSKGIVEAREHGGALAPVTDIDVSDHEGSGDTPKPHAADGVQLLQGETYSFAQTLGPDPGKV